VCQNRSCFGSFIARLEFFAGESASLFFEGVVSIRIMSTTKVPQAIGKVCGQKQRPPPDVLSNMDVFMIETATKRFMISRENRVSKGNCSRSSRDGNSPKKSINSRSDDADGAVAKNPDGPTPLSDEADAKA
jgi:hypothetical protein